MFDADRRDLLKGDPLPTVEVAYATIQREVARRGIMKAEEQPSQGDVPIGIGSGLVVKSAKLVVRSSSWREEVDKSQQKCTHCGGTKHTKEGCFKIIGYPELWPDNKKKGAKGAVVTATVGIQETTSTREDSRQPGFIAAVATSTQSTVAAQKEKENRWLLDCGATDTMSYDPSDFHSPSQPRRSYIQTANGGHSPVEGAGRIDLSLSLKLSNCLYVPSLSHKSLSISHVTKELNCTVLMHPTFYILQDILTRRIIGRGTEQGGLYYVDEVDQ